MRLILFLASGHMQCTTWVGNHCTQGQGDLYIWISKRNEPNMSCTGMKTMLDRVGDVSISYGRRCSWSENIFRPTRPASPARSRAIKDRPCR